MRSVRLRAQVWLVALAAGQLPVCSDATADPIDVGRLEVIAVDSARHRLQVEFPPNVSARSVSQIVVFEGDRPIGWFTPSGDSESAGWFQSPSALVPRELRFDLQGWHVPTDLTAQLLPNWPANAGLLAEIESVGPGARAVWVAAGSNQGVRTDQTWWARSGGQPIARFDIRLVEREVSFCRVVPLVDEPRLRAGALSELWPAPGLMRRGNANSAVSFVESQGDTQMIWVAAPRGVNCPPEPRLDLFRDGDYIGHALVERRDDRFWYARTAPSPKHRDIEVGDSARIRTVAQIEKRTFVARVLRSESEGFIINAGESESLVPGDVGRAWRDGRPLGDVKLKQVQNAYAVVELISDDAGRTLQAGDEIRFAPPPSQPTEIARIDVVGGQTLIVATALDRQPLPLRRALAVRANAQTIGVALLLEQDGNRAIGFVLPCSLVRPVTIGTTLLSEDRE